ncbi:MAG: uracil-DNA glycosylase [Bdellovibrionota bacterium]
MVNIKLSDSWHNQLQSEFQSDYMKALSKFLQKEYESGKVIYPEAQKYFNALDLVDLKNVKVVILGQDPYHGPGQAHGLSFSVPEGVRLPPSLKNIFKELKSDLGKEIPTTGNLERWAKQGVLLLNAVLTVEESKAAAHQKKGWEPFTDKIIEVVNRECDHVVFILWGAYAQKKAAFVDRKKHLVLESVHPSPLSSHRGFFGSKPFSQANTWLQAQGLAPIDW